MLYLETMMPTYPNGWQLLMLATEMSIVVCRKLTTPGKNEMTLGVQQLLHELYEEEKERQQFLGRLLKQVGGQMRDLLATIPKPPGPMQSPPPSRMDLCPRNQFHELPVSLSEGELVQIVIEQHQQQAALFHRLRPAVKDTTGISILEAIIEDLEKGIQTLQTRLAGLRRSNRAQDTPSHPAGAGSVAVSSAGKRRYGETRQLDPREKAS